MTNNLGCQTCVALYPLSVAPEKASSVSISPNPSTSGAFTIHVGAVQPATFTVHDALGRLVRLGQLTSAETDLDLRAQPAGVYILRLTWPDGRTLSKRLLRW